MESFVKIVAILLLAFGTSLFLQRKVAVYRERATVERVIDGDTIDLADGRRVRYIGADAPEIKDCFGREAKEANKKLLEGREIRLEKDVSQTDKYGRLLRYVFVDGIFVDEYILSNGFAKLVTIPPDTRYSERLRSAGQQARDARRGLWQACS